MSISWRGNQMLEESTNNKRKVDVVVKGIWAIVGAVLIGFLSGIGSFQVLVAGEVRAHGIELVNIKEQLKNEKAMVEQRMSNVVLLMESNAKLNADLVSLVREQNRLIERYYLNNK